MNRACIPVGVLGLAIGCAPGSSQSPPPEGSAPGPGKDASADEQAIADEDAREETASAPSSPDVLAGDAGSDGGRTSTIVVNSNDSDGGPGVCTLLMAIRAWEAQSEYGGCTGVTPGVQTISLPVGTLPIVDGLQVAPPASAPNASLRIVGQGTAATILGATGNAPAAAVSVDGAVTVTLSQLTVLGTNLVGVTSGVYSDGDALLTLDHVRVTGFTASGVWNANANVTIQWSTVDGNSSSMFGGGIYEAAQDVNAMPETIVNYSTIADNRATFGGGVYNLGYLNLAYSTIANNTATGGKGGGIYQAQDYLETAHCTIAFNSATGAGGGVYVDPSIAANVHVNSSVIADNLGTSPAQDYSGLLRDGDTSLIDPDVLGVAGGVTGGWFATVDLEGDPRIAPLGANGGPTETCAILDGASNAVDASIADSPPMSTTDQRGLGAPIGSAYDVGAFEWRP